MVIYFVNYQKTLRINVVDKEFMLPFERPKAALYCTLKIHNTSQHVHGTSFNDGGNESIQTTASTDLITFTNGHVKATLQL
jgi:hypothetical protein